VVVSTLNQKAKSKEQKHKTKTAKVTGYRVVANGRTWRDIEEGSFEF
jgi:hypothetical protein